MTEIRNDEPKQKKLATSEQVENMYNRLTREMLTLGAQNNTDFESLDKYCDAIIEKLYKFKIHGLTVSGIVIVLLSILCCTSLAILNKLNALGL